MDLIYLDMVVSIFISRIPSVLLMALLRLSFKLKASIVLKDMQAIISKRFLFFIVSETEIIFAWFLHNKYQSRNYFNI